MSIIRRGKNGICWIRFSHRGQRVQVSAGTRDKLAAEQLEIKLKAEMWRVDKLQEKPLKTWQHAVKRWIEEKQYKKSIDDDKNILVWLDPFLRNLYLHEIKSNKIEEIVTEKKKENPTVSPARINRILALIRSILRAAAGPWDWIDKPPHIRMRKEPDHRTRWLRKEEAEKLISVMKNVPHLRDMAAFSLATGLREQNVCGLPWADIDLKKCHAWVHPDKAKAKKAIAVPLNSDAMEILKKWKGKHLTYVFSYQGHRLSRCNSQAWRDALVRAGIKNFKWHDLRHTWASWHVMSGTSLQELQQLGAWANYRSVLRYAHLSSDHLKAAAERISGANLVQVQKNETGTK